jgi:hypothetical protein
VIFKTLRNPQAKFKLNEIRFVKGSKYGATKHVLGCTKFNRNAEAAVY